MCGFRAQHAKLVEPGTVGAKATVAGSGNKSIAETETWEVLPKMGPKSHTPNFLVHRQKNNQSSGNSW